MPFDFHGVLLGDANTDGVNGEESKGERGEVEKKTGIKIDFSIMLAVSRGRHMF